MKRILPLLAAIPLSSILVSCSSTPKATGGSAVARYQAYDRPASLPSNPSNVRVKVSLKNQMAYVMEGSKPLLIAPVSVGKPGTATPTGNFRAYNNATRRANGHGWAYNGSGGFKQVKVGRQPAGWKFTGTPMPYWVEFKTCLLYTSPSPRDLSTSRMPSSA